MEELQITQNQTAPISPVDTKNLAEPEESNPKVQGKTKIVPLILLGLGISLVIAGLGYLAWTKLKPNSQPDLTIEAPGTKKPSTTPTPTIGETTTINTQDQLFEVNPYRNEDAGFEINVPTGWTVDDSGKSGAIVVLVNPKPLLANDSALLSHISVSVGSTKNSLGVEVQKTKDGLQKVYKNYKITEDKEILQNGSNFNLLDGEFTAKENEFKNRILITINNNKGYAISAIMPASVWSANEILINATLFSFKTL